jgi:hypothetical protein
MSLIFYIPTPNSTYAGGPYPLTFAITDLKVSGTVGAKDATTK